MMAPERSMYEKNRGFSPSLNILFLFIVGKSIYCGTKVKLGFSKFTFLTQGKARGFEKIDTPSKKGIAPPIGGYTLLLSDTISMLANRREKGLLPKEQKALFLFL